VIWNAWAKHPVSEPSSLGIPALPGVKRLLMVLLVAQVFGNMLCKPVSEGKRKWKPNK